MNSRPMQVYRPAVLVFLLLNSTWLLIIDETVSLYSRGKLMTIRAKMYMNARGEGLCTVNFAMQFGGLM